MTTAVAHKPITIIKQIINKQEFFPNNEKYPLLIYKAVFNINQLDAKAIINLLAQNKWGNAWKNGIYDYHHYHSNTHEILVVIAGTCRVIYGGPKGMVFVVNEGDVMIHPAGVSHKREESSENFACVGAYPNSINYDMNYGYPDEYQKATKNIQHVQLPMMDPIFGENGPIFQYWQ